MKKLETVNASAPESGSAAKEFWIWPIGVTAIFTVGFAVMGRGTEAIAYALLAHLFHKMYRDDAGSPPNSVICDEAGKKKDTNAPDKAT